MPGKRVYIIAGSNGSGKTTFAKDFLPHFAECPHFINADLIAQGLSPLSPKQTVLQAGKLVLEQIGELSQKGVDFGFESTLSGKRYASLFKDLKSKGYKICVFYLWIPKSCLAVERVRERVAKGGHHVPVRDVKRRYSRSIRNFFQTYRHLADQWLFFDNTGLSPNLIARKNGDGIVVFDETLFQKISKKI